MADIVGQEPFDANVRRRFREVRSNEYAPEVVALNADGSVIGGGGAGASEAHIGEVGGKIGRPAGSFTRPSNTTPYSANQIIAASGAGAALELPNAARVAGRGGHITNAVLLVSNTAATHSTRLHLWTAQPVAATHVTSLADAAAFALLSTTDYVGWIDFGAFASIGGMAGVQSVGLSQTFAGGAGTSLWAVFQTPAGHTPTSGAVYRLVLKTDQT